MLHVSMTVIGRGHPNIRGTNRRTLEFTSDPYVSPRGDCILLCCIVVEDNGLMDSLEGKGALEVRITVGNFSDSFSALTPMSKPRSSNRIIFRRSSYVDEHTFGIMATKAARDIDRRVVDLLRKGYVGLAEISLVR